jgi:threonine/homoserine/homoserine lactone efflux protein
MLSFNSNGYIGDFRLKIESASIIVVAVCTFITFYFSFLSFQVADDALKRQFLILAAVFLLAGAIIFSCLMVYSGIKRAFRN